MKSILEGLDLSAPDGVTLPPIYPHHRRPDDAFVDSDDYEALRKALEAALGVIDAVATPDRIAGAKFLVDSLEIALAPFRRKEQK